MPLVNAVIAHNGVLLCSDRPLDPTMRQTVTKFVESLPKHDSKASYELHGTTFHTLVENGVLYIVTSEGETPMRMSYGFLTDIKDKFKEQFAGGAKNYPKPGDLSAARCAKFSVTLTATIRSYNEGGATDKIAKVSAALAETKTIMIENIDTVIARGEKIDNLVNKSENLVEESSNFESGAGKLKNLMIMRRLKIICIAFWLLALIIFIIVLIACGGFKFVKCKSDDPAPAPAAATTTTIAPTTTAAAAAHHVLNLF